MRTDKYNKYKLKRKAQIADMIFVIVTLISIAMTMLIAGFIYFEMQPTMTDESIASNESIKAYNDFAIAFPMLDMSFLFIVIALIIGLIISSLFIPSSPIFLVVNIVGFVVLVFLGAVFANLYGEMLEHGGETVTILGVAQANYPITTFIISKLPYIGAIIVLIVTIVMYSKSSSGGFG